MVEGLKVVSEFGRKVVDKDPREVEAWPVTTVVL